MSHIGEREHVDTLSGIFVVMQFGPSGRMRQSLSVVVTIEKAAATTPSTAFCVT